MMLRIPPDTEQESRAPSLGNAALAGVFATYAMDLAGRRIIAPALDEGSGGLGRWIGHMFRGRFTHEDITTAAPVAHGTKQRAVAIGYHRELELEFLLPGATRLLGLERADTHDVETVGGEASVVISYGRRLLPTARSRRLPEDQ